MARTVTSYEIRPRSELRVEVLSGSEAEIMLKEGTAEVFGTEARAGPWFRRLSRACGPAVNGFRCWHLSAVASG